MLRKAYVEIPELPEVEKYVLIDRPGIIYINLSCSEHGIIRIVPEEKKKEREKPKTPT